MEGKDAALQQVPGDPRVDKCFAVCIMPAGEGKDTRGLLDKKKKPRFYCETSEPYSGQLELFSYRRHGLRL